MRRGREIHLVSRPSGAPSAANFAMVDVDVPEPGAGQVLVRNTYLSVDPYMRGRMDDGPSYVAPFGLGQPLDGGAVGVVDASRDARLPVGTTVMHSKGWRDYAVGGGDAFRPVDTLMVPPSAYLGVLGMPGFTAYIGVALVADVRRGETFFVSAAAGAVGSVAGQLAKRKGARVIGSTRSRDAAKLLRDKLHFDDVIVSEPGRIREQLRAAAPTGIDVYFENVGGETLEAALDVLKDFGRVAVCGMIATPSGTAGPRNLRAIVQKRLRLQGFIVSDHMTQNGAFTAEIAPAVAAGELIGLETFVDGLERAPDAFLSLFEAGGHIGKLIVRC